MGIRLNRGGAYTSDISTLRRQIRANGSVTNCFPIQVTHPGQPGAVVNMVMNLAFQPNGNLPPANASLYISAFTNAAGTYLFNIAPMPCIALAGVILPAVDGSYLSLGYGLGLPPITDANLAQSVAAVSNFAGGIPGANVLSGLARLIIAVSEAVRFDAVEQGIDGVLGNAGVYQPPVAVIHNWGGHFIGS